MKNRFGQEKCESFRQKASQELISLIFIAYKLNMILLNVAVNYKNTYNSDNIVFSSHILFIFQLESHINLLAFECVYYSFTK